MPALRVLDARHPAPAAPPGDAPRAGVRPARAAAPPTAAPPTAAPPAPAPGDDPDAAAVERVRRGDADAFAEIVRRHYGACLRYAERLLGDRADAEDAVQETFIRAYDALGRYEERSRFRAWLFAVLATECRAQATRRARRARRLVRDEAALHGAVAPDAAPPVDAAARLDRALGRLEPRLREAFLLRHVEQLSYDEMRAATGAGTSALKMRVMRAVAALRALLEEP